MKAIWTKFQASGNIAHAWQNYTVYHNQYKTSLFFGLQWIGNYFSVKKAKESAESMERIAYEYKRRQHG